MDARPTVIPDVRELILNGDFANWTGDNPDNWVVSENPPVTEISQVGTGEGHGGIGTGYCNLYSSNGSNVFIHQTITVVVGKKYRVSINIDTATAQSVRVYEGNHTAFDWQVYSTSGIKTFVFTATHTDARIALCRHITSGITDITFDDISVKPVRQNRHKLCD